MGTSENAILERWLVHRDAAAFQSIVQQHAGRVYATCRRILRNGSEAEDLTQECFESLAEAAGNEKPRMLGPWLHGMAANKCLMHLRSEGRRKDREATYAAEQPSKTDPQWNDISAIVDEAVLALPPELRVPVQLHYLYGKSHAAIARTTNLPRRTVTNRIQKGVDLVGQSLGKRGVIIPVAGLAVLLGSNLGEASVVPATLVTTFGKIALAQSAQGIAGTSVSGGGALSLLWVALATKKVAIGLAFALAVVGGLWAIERTVKRDDASLQQVAKTPDKSDTSRSESTTAITTTPHAAGVVMGKELAATSLSGTVKLFGSNQPIPGVTVEAWNTDTRATQFEIVSDDAGHYAIAGLTPGTRYTLLALGEKEGYKETNVQSVTLKSNEVKANVDITVCQSSISGQVLDKTVSNHPSALAKIPNNPNLSREEFATAWKTIVTTKDQPLPGVKVVLGTPGADNASIGYVFQQTVTDEHGRYLFRCVRPGKYMVRAETPEGAVKLSIQNRDRGADTSITPNEKKTDIDFSFRFDGLTVEGNVTNSKGTAIPNAVVHAQPLDILLESGEPIPLRTSPVDGITDSAGAYRLDNLCPAGIQAVSAYMMGTSLPRGGETYVLSASAEGYAPSQIVLPMISADLEREAREFITQSRQYSERLGIDSESGLVPQYRDIPLPVNSGNTIQRIDFKLAKEATVTGILADTRGQTLSKCRIRMLSTAKPDPKSIPLVQRGMYPDWIETGSGGEFRFSGVPAGSYAFEVARESGTQTARNAALDVTAGAEMDSVNVVVESIADRGKIAGRVVDAVTNQPIPKFTVSVYSHESPGEQTPTHGTPNKNESNGTFAIDSVSPGLVTLFAFAEGYAPLETKVNVVKEKESTVSIGLSPQGLIEGQMSINGMPAQGTLTARRADSIGIPNAAGYYDPFVQAEADESGHFLIEGLAAGAYTVSTNAVTGKAQTTYFRHESTAAFVEAGKVTRLDINVTGSASLHGTFTFPAKYRRGRVHLLDGNATAALSSDDSTLWGNLMRASTERMRESGPYEFNDLKPGTYTLVGFCYNNRELEGTGEETDRPRTWQLVTLGNNENAVVDFEFTTP